MWVKTTNTARTLQWQLGVRRRSGIFESWHVFSRTRAELNVLGRCCSDRGMISHRQNKYISFWNKHFYAEFKVLYLLMWRLSTLTATITKQDLETLIFSTICCYRKIISFIHSRSTSSFYLVTTMGCSVPDIFLAAGRYKSLFEFQQLLIRCWCLTFKMMPRSATVYTKQANTNQGQRGCLEVTTKHKWKKWENHPRFFFNIVPNQRVQ